MQNAKFQVGDMVIGNSHNHYGITSKGWIGTVIFVDESDPNYIRVKGKEGDTWDVEAEYFDMHLAVSEVKQSYQNVKILPHLTYKLEEASFDSRNNVFLTKTNTYYPTDIVAVDGELKSLFVICGCCGTIIPNTQEERDKHTSAASSSESCLKCSSLTTRKNTIDSVKRTKNDDGTYKVEEVSTCTLQCGYYRNVNIEDPRARTSCKYRGCTADKLYTISNIHIDNPGAFDKFATVDALDAKQWTFERRISGQYYFKARKRFTLRAVVNNIGIIDRFIYSYNSNDYGFVYSHKYGKIFWKRNGEFYDNIPYADNATEAKILSVVSELYKGE